MRAAHRRIFGQRDRRVRRTRWQCPAATPVWRPLRQPRFGRWLRPGKPAMRKRAGRRRRCGDERSTVTPKRTGEVGPARLAACAILMVLRTKSHLTGRYQLSAKRSSRPRHDAFFIPAPRARRRVQSMESSMSKGADGASIKNAPQRGLCDQRWRGSLRRKRRDRRMMMQTSSSEHHVDRYSARSACVRIELDQTAGMPGLGTRVRTAGRADPAAVVAVRFITRRGSMCACRGRAIWSAGCSNS